MVQAAEDRDRADAPTPLRSRRSSRWRGWDLVLPALMGPVLIEVAYVRPQHAPQVPFAQNQDVVEALAPDAAEEALAGGVLPGGAIGRPPLRDAAGFGL